MKTLAIIGSTGSIGKSSLKVFEKNKKSFVLNYISCNKNSIFLKKQIKKYKPKFFYINNKFQHNKIKYLKNFKSIDYFIKKKIKFDYVISAVSGYDSINLNIKLLKISKNLLLANKETIICGGKIFLSLAKKEKCKIIPIDSEHFCINFFLKNFNINQNQIKKIILMASGGPFFKKKPKFKELKKNVLKHPNWKMGSKISVDSATMANKVMEMFEAKILFSIPNDKIDIRIENKSIIHSIVTLNNNLNFFIAHNTTMEVPISVSLGCQNRFNLILDSVDLNIQSVSYLRFPITKLGFKILNYGHAGMILFTVINERLVNQYLNNTIFYGEISKKLINFFKKNKIVKMSKKCIKRKSDIFKLINFAKKIRI